MILRAALLGSWRLERAELLRGGVRCGTLPFGARPDGILHYLADGRMAVLIAHDGRGSDVRSRAAASDAEWAQAARSFTAYAGTFELVGDTVIHHVDLNSHQADVGTAYVRLAHLAGTRLTLSTPPDLPADQRAMALDWQRLPG